MFVTPAFLPLSKCDKALASSTLIIYPIMLRYMLARQEISSQSLSTGDKGSTKETSNCIAMIIKGDDVDEPYT